MMDLTDSQSPTESLSANSLPELFSLATPDLLTPLASTINNQQSTINQQLSEINVGQKREPDAANDEVIVNENTPTVIDIIKNDFGDLDVIIGNDGTNFLWQNNGKGILTNAGILGGSLSSAVALGDLNQDGYLDAVVGNYGQGNTVWLSANDGTGKFKDSGQSLGNSLTTAVALGDLDGDEDLDLFEGNNRQGNKVWFNDGTGKFTDSGQSLGNFFTTAIAIGDLDGNGTLDVFEGNAAQPNRIWLNNGSGIFTDSGQTLGDSFTKAVALGDLNGDNNIDAFIGNVGQPNQVWLNQGGGVFINSEQALGNTATVAVALADLNADKHLDVFVGNAGQTSEVWLNDGSGKFTDTKQKLGNSLTQSVALGDLDNDQDIDAFLANKLQANKVWLNDGSGKFTDSGQNLGNAASLAVALGDIDKLRSDTLRLINKPNNGTVTLNRETGEIVYTPKPSFNGDDQFSYQVFDGDSYSTTAEVKVTVLPVNDAPFVAINSGINLSPELKKPQPITNVQLQVMDVEQSGAELTYTLTESPTIGSLKLGATELTVGKTFTQADIDKNLLIYELTKLEKPSDRFSFTVSDGQGGELASQSFNINIGGANIPLTLANNQALTLDEGRDAAITKANLETVSIETGFLPNTSASETGFLPDTSTETGESTQKPGFSQKPGFLNILYTLTALPKAGKLNQNGTELKLGDNFTQEEINSNAITYQHDGSETVTDIFSFTATSPGVAAITGSFNIAIVPVDSTENVNVAFSVKAGETAAIKTANLPGSQPSASQTGNNPETNPLVYTLTSLPENGTLLVNGTPLGLGNTLTQTQINNNEINYLHNGTETTSDKFNLTIFDTKGNSITTEFNITVNPVNNPPSLEVNNGMTIKPGAIAVIGEGALFSQTNESTQIQYILTSTPTSGTLKLAGNPLSPGMVFTPADLAQNILTYQQEIRNTQSESQSDAFTFNVVDTLGGVTPGTFNITITPTNESPTMLINRQLTLRKPGQPAVINQGYLQAIDPNNDPLTYTLVSVPASGTLLLNGSALKIGSSFTQDQVNNHQLIYQNTNGSVKKDLFTFTIADPFGGVLANQVFNIAIA
jgi:hypothetical protein